MSVVITHGSLQLTVNLHCETENLYSEDGKTHELWDHIIKTSQLSVDGISRSMPLYQASNVISIMCYGA